MLIFANVFYTAPLTVGMIYYWFYFAGFPRADWNIIEAVTLMNVIAVIFITHIYETVFLIRERESDIVQFEKLERARAEAELEALKSQIDPHFLFNSLNTLSHLIKNDPQKAFLFNENLSDMYRYILMNKDRELVQLREEIEFLNNYYSLLRLRFGNRIKLSVNGCEDAGDYLIPPISLQILLENAVKHNQIDEYRPLTINMRIENSAIVFSNKRRPKSSQIQTSKIGLKNLRERYKLITNRDLEINSGEHQFSVRLPLLKTSI